MNAKRSGPWTPSMQIVGDIPQRGDRSRVAILVAESETERKLLDHFAAEYLANVDDGAPIYIAHVSSRGFSQTEFDIDGLGDPLATLNSIDLIPIGVAWEPDPALANSWRRTHKWMRVLASDRLQRATLNKSPERIKIIIGEMGTKKDLVARNRQRQGARSLDDQSANKGLLNYIAMQAALTVERDARRATGRMLKLPKHVHAAMWGRADLHDELRRISEETGESLDKIETRARSCMKELIPRPSPSHISLLNAFLRRVSRLGYASDINYHKEQMLQLRELTLTEPTALVWTHKTHMDGVAVALACYDEGFPLVHMIGGDNMAFAGMGYLAKRAGTVFIRRKIDDPVYKEILKTYLGFLLEKRFPVSWALEGTRSRNGKLMPPRFGILKYVIDAAEKESMHNLQVVPISIHYDLIAEIGDYAAEQSGVPKRKESLAWFAKYLGSLRRRLGRISLSIGNTVTVDASKNHHWAADTDADGENVVPIDLQKIAFQAAVNANNVTPIMVSSLIGLVLSGAAPRAVTASQLAKRANEIRKWAEQRGYAMTEDIRSVDTERAADILEMMLDFGLIKQSVEAKDTLYSIASGKEYDVAYYRNTAIHFFVTKSIAETALAMTVNENPQDQFNAFWSNVEQIRDTFKFEFFYPDSAKFRVDITDELDRYDANWEQTLRAGNAIELLNLLRPHVAHAVLRPFSDSYRVIADILASGDTKDASDKDAVIDFALKLGRQKVLQGEISSGESVSKLVFSNGYKLANQKGLLVDGSDHVEERRTQFLLRFKDLARAMELVDQTARNEHKPAPPRRDPPVLKVV